MVELLHDDTAFPGGLDIWRANEPTDLPPIRRWDRRLREYPVNYGYFMRDPRARITQAGIEFIANFNPNARITQFGLEVIVSLVPQGEQLSGNPPAGRPRSVDYSFVPPINPALLSFIQPLNAGDSQATSTALPPRAPARARDYTWFNAPLPDLFAQDAMLPDHTTDSTALPPRGPARSTPDNYNFTASYFQGLIGQDAIPTGDQLSGNAPIGRPRASTLSEPGVNATIILTAPAAPIAPGKTTQHSEIPPRAPARLNDYTWLRSLPIHLIGQDAFNPGDQYFDLPPRGPLRARDYTWTYTLPAQFPPPAGALPAGKQYLSNEPRAAARLRGEYPHLTRGALPLLLAPVTTAEQFQAILII